MESTVRLWNPGRPLDVQAVIGGLSRGRGDLDDITGFVAHHPQVAEAARRFSGWRVPRTGLVLEALIPAIIAQKVTGQEASDSYRTLLHRYGERAPGEGGARGLWVAPTASGWARIPSWEWLRAGVDDDGLAGRLEPYAGHRYRVQRLLKLAGAMRPRRGPRMPARTHLPHRFR
ncbi:MAG: DNA glycosylase family protein [Dermatophilaceae bacterium]